MIMKKIIKAYWRPHIALPEVHKCINGINPAYMHDMFLPLCHKYNTRNYAGLEQCRVNTVSNGLHSFKYEGAKYWNILPANIKNAPSQSVFKNLISMWVGPDCSCGTCIWCTIQNV